MSFLKQKTKTTFFIYGLIVGLTLFLVVGTLFIRQEGNKDESFVPAFKVTMPPLPDNPEFCGERVPVESFEVKERLEREMIINSYFHSSTIITLKRANRWFPVIEPILKANGVPDDFKYLAAIESGLANVISPAGATGYWQFLEEPAKKYGLEINDEIDERYHLEKATEAACKYLTEAYLLFGSWTAAAASYNMGIQGVQKQFEKQKTNNYYNLVLSEETTRYIARIIAMKEILLNPEKYGFFIDGKELYKPLEYEEVEVTGSVANFADYASEKGINYKILKYYNPWLRDNFITNRQRKTYRIKIPVEGTMTVIPELQLD